jgi:hypothetical protein
VDQGRVLVIAELAAFNAAFGVVKGFVANGKDCLIALGAIGQMVQCEGRPQIKAG